MKRKSKIAKIIEAADAKFTVYGVAEVVLLLPNIKPYELQQLREHFALVEPQNYGYVLFRRTL